MTSAARPPERFEELAQYDIDPESSRKLPQDFCEKNNVCILGRISPANLAASVPVGMLDPSNDQLVREIEMVIGRRARPVQLNAYEVKLAIRRAFGLETGQTGRIATVQLDAVCEIHFAPEQAAAAMLDDLLSVAVKQGATDVHIETYAKDVDLRFRKDGVLRQIATPLSPENVKKVISRVKVISNLDIAAKPHPVDGRFNGRYSDEKSSGSSTSASRSCRRRTARTA